MSELSLERSCLMSRVSSWISAVGSPKRLLSLATVRGIGGEGDGRIKRCGNFRP